MPWRGCTTNPRSAIRRCVLSTAAPRQPNSRNRDHATGWTCQASNWSGLSRTHIAVHQQPQQVHFVCLPPTALHPPCLKAVTKPVPTSCCAGPSLIPPARGSCHHAPLLSMYKQHQVQQYVQHTITCVAGAPAQDDQDRTATKSKHAPDLLC
jgi:hypothetical protein